MEYKVHKFELNMATDQHKLERFLNELEGEVVAVIPNTTTATFLTAVVDFLLIVEKLP